MTEQLKQTEIWAHLIPTVLTAQTINIKCAVESGSTRELEKLVGSVCPSERWIWPAYETYALRIGNRPTRARMVAALCHRILRDAHWTFRMPQLLANTQRRPLWQFRAAGDSRDPLACKNRTGQVEHFESIFWLNHIPAQCTHVYCRCTIRAYCLDESTEIHPPTVN
jgi:hypothetical protein